MSRLLFQHAITLLWFGNMLTSDIAQPLLITPYLKQGDITSARNLSLIADTDDVIPTSYSGFMTVDELLGNHLFFWFFPAINADPKAPLVVWLNGGPSVPSTLGLFHENGPLKFKKSDDGHVGFERRNNSWAETFSMLYIDNPVGVGYSYSDSGEEGYRTSQDGYSKDLFEFIQQFYIMFPEYLQRELYIGGQSYAGKYVPAFAYRIHEEIQANRSNIPLTGIYLGGPFIDPETQWPHIYDLFYSLGYVSLSFVSEFKSSTSSFLNEVIYRHKEFNLLTDFSNIYQPVCNGCWDNLNTLEFPPYDELEYIMSKLKSVVHADNVSFVKENLQVYSKLSYDFLSSTKLKMAELMDIYKVLIFNGALDGAISSPLVELAMMSTPWSLQFEYNSSARHVWTNQNKTIVLGFYSHVGQFCRVVVRGAGHQVPHDQPESTQQMMSSFIDKGCVF